MSHYVQVMLFFCCLFVRLFDNTFFRTGFVVDSIAANIRLDGRTRTAFRDPVLSLTRNDEFSCAELGLGGTKIVACVRGELVAPFPDRPTEGIIQFNCTVSVATKASGYFDSDIVTHLEKYVKQSDAIDLESLCVISGKRVWLIVVDINVIDYAGNVIDASLFAAMAALRAFRRPEVSLSAGDDISSSSSSGSSNLVKHKFDDREPLPLAFHHTPLSISIGIFHNSRNPDEKVFAYLFVQFNSMLIGG
jgi:exosome complex component RRP45